MNAESDSYSDFAPVSPSNAYALSGKIMIIAILVLIFIVLIMICLHLYARWYLLRIRRRDHLGRRAANRRRTHLVFFVDQHSIPSRGLDPSILRRCPVFLYSSQTHSDSMECAVCLSEFEDGEIGRLLPKCNHSFHVDCIDMWFHSHSTCPLCRSVVEPDDVEISVGEPGIGNEPGSSSDAQASAPAPVSRMLSLKRILSRDRRESVSPSPCGSVTELDTEQIRGETRIRLGGNNNV